MVGEEPVVIFPDWLSHLFPDINAETLGAPELIVTHLSNCAALRAVVLLVVQLFFSWTVNSVPQKVETLPG